MIRLGGLISQKAFGKFEMGKVISNPYANAFIKEGEGEDHEVSMANNSIDIIIKMATELKAKMGEDEKQIPAWIQDHIAKAENLISQASGNYHEYGDSNESVNEAPAKLKHTISKKEWSKIPKYNKHIGMDGVHYIMKYDDKIGTYLQGVQIVDESVNEAPNTGEKIQNLNNRIKVLRDKISATKSPEQKKLFSDRLKNALQSLSNIKKDHSIKAPHRESVVNEDNTPFETLMLIRNLEQTNKLLAQDLKTSKRLPNDKKENIKKSIVVNQGLINYYKESYKNLKNNESVNEDTRRAKLLGIDFNISEMNGRIFFSFVDKKAASLKIREIGTNKIVNLIQKSLDNAYGKGEFFFKGGDHAEFQNGYLFQRNLTNVKLNKLKFESVNEASPCWKGYKQVGMKDKGGRQVPNCVPNESVVREASGRVPQIFLKTGAVEKKIKELMADRKKAVVPYNTEKDPTKKESLKQILIKLTKQIQGYEKNLIQLRDKEEEYIQQMNADAQLDVSAID